MTINNRQDYVIIDLINQAVRNVRAQPINLGGVSGVGGGEGGPPGGFIGLLAQTKIAYDTNEDAYLGLLSAPSGTLLDNLAHIRYRLHALEIAGSGGGGGTGSGGGSSFTGDPNRVVLTDGSGALVTEDWLARGTNYIEFGANVGGKDSNAGKMGYNAFSSAFDIVGAGSTVGERYVTIFDQLNVDIAHFGNNIYIQGVLLDDYITNIGDARYLATVGGLDSIYLRLDTSNDPLSGQLSIINYIPGDDGLYIQTQGQSYTADFEQYTDGDNITYTPTLFLYRETYGIGDITAPMLEIQQRASSTGLITGDYLSLEDSVGNPVFRVDKDGHAYDNGNLLITEAPIDGNTYGRQDGGWVIVSGGSFSLTVRDISGTPTVTDVDTITFSGAVVTNLGGGEVLVTVSGGSGGGSTTADAIVANTTALVTTEGKLRWDTTNKVIVLYDTQRERPITPIGWMPFAYPLYGNPGSLASSTTFAAQWVSLLIPMKLEAPMLLQSVSIRNASTSNARSWRWSLYAQYLNNGNSSENTITRVAQSNGSDAFTPSAAGIRTLDATSAPIVLAPGIYWIILQNDHASNTLVISSNTTVTQDSSYKSKTLSGDSGGTIDVVTGWSTILTNYPFVRLNGRVFGETAKF